MPFKSEKQRRYLWLKHPEVAKEFAKKTPKGKKLPMRIKKKIIKEAETKYEDLAVIPEQLAERVLGEVYTGKERSKLPLDHSLNKVEVIEALRQKMTEKQKEKFVEYVSKKCRYAYENKLGYFMKIVNAEGDEGRDQLMNLIRYWLQAFLLFPTLSKTIKESITKKEIPMKKKPRSEAVEVNVDKLTDDQEAEVLAELVGYTDDQLEEKFNENLNDSYGDVDIAGMKFETARALKELDETAYRTDFNDWLDSLISDEDLVEVGGTYFKRSDIEEYFEEKESEVEEEEEEAEEEVETPVEKDEPIGESRTNTLTEGSMDLYVKCLGKQRLN